MSMCVYVCLRLCFQCVCMCGYMRVCVDLKAQLDRQRLSVCLCVRVCANIRLSPCLCVSVSVSLAVSVCLCVSTCACDCCAYLCQHVGEQVCIRSCIPAPIEYIKIVDTGGKAISRRSP